MKQSGAGAIVIGIFTLLVLILRVARCSNKIDKMQWASGQADYTHACQDVLDSTYIVFKPVADAMSSGKNIPAGELTAITIKLYDMATKAKQIDAFDDEGGYYKKRIEEFVEFERGLTCCYLPNYQQEMQLSSSKIKMATVTNLRSWISRYEHWRPKYQDEHFNYHLTADFSLLKVKLNEIAANLGEKKTGTTELD
ncbi:MAG: hypothetical protein QM791_01070 [Ferruginibacter sp.]